MKERATRELEGIPYGVFSGLKENKIAGIFFYYKYGKDSHYWYLYDINSGELKKSKTEIIDFIACPPEEKRVIPDFFEKVYEINQSILEDIEHSFKEIEQKQTTDSALVELSRDRSTKFVGKIIEEIEHEIDDYLTEFPEDRQVEEFWEPIKNKMLSVPFTKKRLRELRRVWRGYRKEKDWKKLMKGLNDFLWEKGIRKKEPVRPFDKNLLKLVVIDFVS